MLFLTFCGLVKKTLGQKKDGGKEKVRFLFKINVLGLENQIKPGAFWRKTLKLKPPIILVRTLTAVNIESF